MRGQRRLTAAVYPARHHEEKRRDRVAIMINTANLTRPFYP